MKPGKYTATLLLLTIFATAYSKQNVVAAVPQKTDSSLIEETISPCAEQTKWYYRTVDGKSQRRLWSITKSMWLTDWEYI